MGLFMVWTWVCVGVDVLEHGRSSEKAAELFGHSHIVFFFFLFRQGSCIKEVVVKQQLQFVFVFMRLKLRSIVVFWTGQFLAHQRQTLPKCHACQYFYAPNCNFKRRSVLLCSKGSNNSDATNMKQMMHRRRINSCTSLNSHK